MRKQNSLRNSSFTHSNAEPAGIVQRMGIDAMPAPHLPGWSKLRLCPRQQSLQLPDARFIGRMRA